MTQMTRVSLVVCVLVSVILIGGGAFAKSADNLRQIVKFRGIDMTEPEDLATARSVVKMSLGFSNDRPPPEASHPGARQQRRDYGGLCRQPLHAVPGPGRWRWR